MDTEVVAWIDRMEALPVNLKQPLDETQIDAAAGLYNLLESWRTTDSALANLVEFFPEFDLQSCLLKTVTINSLYSTQVFATWRMALHVHQTLAWTNIGDAGPELVENLAALPKTGESSVERRFRSFASKFAHFFIDPEIFPILDSWAERMIRCHLGRNRAKNDQYTYLAFHENFFTIKRAAGIDHRSNRHLDRYFWLAGQYHYWLKHPTAVISREVQELFESNDKETKLLLSRLVPPDPDD